ncbi:hypothetical protein DPMN_071353 [Dreissena polymorpha]|uniref:Uncharacterized protein n=1 Tax=Dreissena polymorpha TaxID=45954 RepID=A0A9D3Z6K3_DREPO|nr:hypothetical protein DPMN_071353 [Dreissena polymorpha]
MLIVMRGVLRIDSHVIGKPGILGWGPVSPMSIYADKVRGNRLKKRQRLMRGYGYALYISGNSLSSWGGYPGV